MPRTSNELPKAYDAAAYEKTIYDRWEKSGYFNPDKLPGTRTENYSIMMPPPNVTGVLHVGHVLEQTILDAKVRFERMRGKRAVLIPGVDHAAVATQARVEKDLIEKGHPHPRDEFGRERLLEMIRSYAESSKSTICSQIRSMGTSCDWSRFAYTLDEERSKAVYALFQRMYEDGLIYRGYRVVNWSVKGQSTASDDELVYMSRDARLYTFSYSKDFPIPIATTRPETKLGDTAVAVHPSDTRYASYIGKVFTVDIGAEHPLQIRIIGDPAVDQTFGTGAVGVTPAHSMVDFELKERHDLELIQVIGSDGHMTKEAGRYAGMSVEQARASFVTWLKKENLLISEEDTQQNVATSDRFGDVIEVVPMLQWFVGVDRPIKRLKGKTLKDLMRTGGEHVTIVPERYREAYGQWIDHLHDWCISRQIWWGHRVPVWYSSCGEVFVSQPKPTDPCSRCGSVAYTPDEDTLDTWFSSGTWTFSTLGWPQKTKDFARFHPSSWMQMGYEILFFWMARMILMSTYALGSVPFQEVYIHGLVRGKDGRKFSKSLRNSADPLEMSARYGTDALRMSLIAGVTPGNDVTFYDEKVEHYQHFVNKLWNISRYIIGNCGTEKRKDGIPDPKTASDKWVLSRLSETSARMTDSLERSDFSAAAQTLYEFTWSDFADWYIEIAKVESRRSEKDATAKHAVLLYVIRTVLRLAHPLMPFVTEVLWEHVAPKKSLLMVTEWPRDTYKASQEVRDALVWVQDVVTTIREHRSTQKIPSQTKVMVTSRIPHPELKDVIEALARCTLSEADTASISVQAESVMSETKRQEIRDYIKQLESKLSNKAFIKNAPEAIVAQERKKLEEAKSRLGL